MNDTTICNSTFLAATSRRGLPRRLAKALRASRRATATSLLVLASFLLGARDSHSAVVSVQVAAQVDFVQGTPFFGINPALGDPITGSFTFDTSALDTDPYPGVGVYHSGTISVTIGGKTFSNSGPAVHLVFDTDPASGSDLYQVITGLSQTGSPMLIDGVPSDIGHFYIGFTPAYGGFPSDALPSAADFSNFVINQFVLVDDSGVDPLPVIGFSEAATWNATVVPEPASLLILAACATVGYFLRRPTKRGQIYF